MGEFSVAVFYDDGFHRYIDRWLPAKEAVMLAKDMADLMNDHVERIIITDGGDFTVFEWKQGEGVTFPKREKEQHDGTADRDPRTPG